MARTRRPNTVRDRSTEKTTNTITNVVTTVDFSDPIRANTEPASAPKPKSMLVLLVSRLARPRMPIMEARVTMKGWIRRLAMTNPFNAPTSADPARAHAMAKRIFAAVPAAGAHAVRHNPVREVASASVLPTLRSMPAVRMTRVIPTAMIPISETCRRTSVRLPTSRKIRSPEPERGLVRTASRMMIARPNPLCRFTNLNQLVLNQDGSGIRTWCYHLTTIRLAGNCLQSPRQNIERRGARSGLNNLKTCFLNV